MTFRLIGEQTNKENDGHVGVYSQKYPNSVRQDLVKKQAFNELKNVMYNQPIATPLKHGEKGQRLVKQSRSILRDQEWKQIKSKQSFSSETFNWDNMALIDCCDYNRLCCTKPYKSDAEVWGEINLFDDSFLKKVIMDEDLSIPSDDEESIANGKNLYNDDSDDKDDTTVNDLSSTSMLLLAGEGTFEDMSYEVPPLLEDFDEIL